MLNNLNTTVCVAIKTDSSTLNMVVKRTNRPINLQNDLLNFSYFVYLILNTYNNKLDSEIGQCLHFVVFVSDVLTRRVLVTQEGRLIFFGIVLFF